MNKNIFLLLLLLPLLTGSSLVVKDGREEVGRVETHDGSSAKEVISEKELKEEAGGYTKLESVPEAAKMSENEKALLEAPAVPIENQRGDYGILKGITEREVEEIASRENMGAPNKTTEYAAGDTFPARTWAYEYATGNTKHFFKVHFDMDGKVVRTNHQTETI